MLDVSTAVDLELEDAREVSELANMRLVCAVIASAYIDLKGGVGYRKAVPNKFNRAHRASRLRAKEEAALWFFSDSEEPFSFLWCCLVLGVDSGLLRDVARTIETSDKSAMRLRFKAQVNK